jgi:hypothetical protein
MTDVIFKQNSANEYELDGRNELIKNDLNKILDLIENTNNEHFKKISRSKDFLKKCKVYVDKVILKQVLTKYTRDVFGQKRLSALLKKVPNYDLQPDKMERFGLKINSSNPYIHRRVGYFMYWCSLLKPFHIEVMEDITVSSEDKYILECFNELCTYSLIKLALESLSLPDCKYKKCTYKKTGQPKPTCSLTINLDDDTSFLKDFLRDTHYRNLSRSSLELFLSRACITYRCDKGPCPLNTMGFDTRNIMFFAETGKAATGKQTAAPKSKR